ncbi:MULTISPECIES: rod shape-determining protein MreC [Paenibacillus]|uniref:Cell shape-determining protein MreC n=1 Tax=Paenibacillus rhizosphaerae TaxID=297318 RepID=A0A1R1EF12_9BACL|nr:MULTISPECIES: rod shape-determining protein MreC [Paenibacillus]MBJ9992168.1 rod shape-determining protein MreC [Paenibacillus sp. S28]OMF50423.1 rod shape-determining protein MreC [Paenibacillus rhizosphaerae]OXL85187.1 rod shape-determining protein MreC [Paenibacillus sp. SSG-1]UYO07110.1 rod shape-determining protein MreC [Paenibacillus sp. PSB04]
MLELFKLLGNKRLFVILIGLVMFIALMGFTLGPRASLSWPEKFLRDTVGFAQNIFYKPAGYIAGLFKDIANMRDIYKENEELKIALAHYTRDKVQYNLMDKRNKDLEEALHFTNAQKEQNNYTYHITQVVSVNSDTVNRSLVIDLGERDGIKVGQSVISSEGLVGVISHVSNFTSTVKLITTMDAKDPNSNGISATALNNHNVFGIIESYDEVSKTLQMTQIKEDDPIKEKDTIVSAGDPSKYPQGLIIGTVEKVQVSPFGKTKTATIKPAAEFQDWKLLFVVSQPEVPQ